MGGARRGRAARATVCCSAPPPEAEGGSSDPSWVGRARPSAGPGGDTLHGDAAAAARRTAGGTRLTSSRTVTSSQLAPPRRRIGDEYAEHNGAEALGTLAPELAGTSCSDGTPLPPGEYELLVIAHAGGPDVDFHVIADRATITLDS